MGYEEFPPAGGGRGEGVDREGVEELVCEGERGACGR